MVLPDYSTPTRDGQEPNASRSSLYKSRHISLQSRVNSLAAERMWDGSGESVPEMPAVYSIGRVRSTNLLMDSRRKRLSDPESMMDRPKSQFGQSPSPDPSPDPQGPPQAIRLAPFHEAMFIGVVVMANFMALAGLGQAIAPRQIIADGLGVHNPGEEAWFAAGYSLTVGTFILISGRMGDILGHKRMFVFGYFFLGMWSCFAGFSAYVGKQIFFDVCRAFQGIGAALLAPNALALLGRAYPPGVKKNIVFSLYGAMAPWGFVIGALFGSIFAQLLWWPWLFWSYGFAGFALSAFALLIIPKALAYEAQFAGQALRPRMDWTGAVLGVSGLVLINVAWNNGPLFGWGVPNVYLCLILGLFLLVAFFWVEVRAISPILPVGALNSTVNFTMALVAIGWGSFGIWIYYSWRFLEELRFQSPLTVSVEFVPALICGLIAAGATGFMLTHTPVSFTMLIAMLAFFIGHVIAGTMPVKQIYWAQMFVSILVMPFGMDMSFPAATVILSNHMPREHQGLAASLVNTMVNYSISLALGIAGTVEVSVNNKGATFDDVVWGIRCAYYTGIALSACGVILGAAFFAKTMLKEGWKIMDN